MLKVFLEEFEPGRINGNNDINKLVNRVVFDHDLIENEQFDLYIIAAEDFKQAEGEKNNRFQSNVIRQKLYELVAPWKSVKIADLGNLIDMGEEKNLENLSSILAEVLQKKGTVILLGNAQFFAYAQYLAYVKLQKHVQMVLADEYVKLEDYMERFDNNSYLTKTFISEPNFLFSFSLLGYQSYFLHPKYIDTLEKLSFNTYRLGELRQDFKEAEPIVRDADMLSFNLNSLKSGDALGVNEPTPNGFTGEEACAVCRYAGLSDKLSSISIFEYNKSRDTDAQTAMLAAQMCWYFIEGFYNRKNDYPEKENMDNFIQYMVTNETLDRDIVFWKSKKSGRWWIQHYEEPAEKFSQHKTIPCSYNEYLKACQGEIPEKFFNARKRMGFD